MRPVAVKSAGFSDKVHVYGVAFVNGTLTWQWVESARGRVSFSVRNPLARGLPLGGASFAFWPVNGRPVSESDAVGLTGLLPPACWDKLQEMM